MNAPSCSSADTEGTGRITPDAPASPAPPQGEREAFEAAVKQTPAFAQVRHLLARRDFPGALRPGTYVNEAVEFAWGLWQARASLSASTPSAEALDAARYRWLRDNEWPMSLASVIKLQQNARWDAAVDAAMAPPADNKENGNG